MQPEEKSKAPEVVIVEAGALASLDDETKSILTSRTVWLGVLMALVPMFPPAAALVAANPALTGLIAGAATLAMRVLTRKPVRIVPPKDGTSKPGSTPT